MRRVDNTIVAWLIAIGLTVILVLVIVAKDRPIEKMNRIKTSQNLSTFLPSNEVEEIRTFIRQIYIADIVMSDVVPVGTKEVPGGVQILVPDNYVGWWDESALPEESGNIVLLGHSTQVLNRLHLIEIGDEIILEDYDGYNHHYQVTKTVLVQEEGVSVEQRIENAKHLLPTSTERITLITCSNGTRDRLIVIAEPIDE